jgi:hypothetical protein
MKTVSWIGSVVLPIFLLNTIGIFNTLFCFIVVASFYCMANSLMITSRSIKRDLDIIEREEYEEECVRQNTIDEVDAFLNESINKRQKNQDRLVIIEKKKSD